MTRLALLRHGHTAWNRAGRIQGRTDIPLDDEAAEALAALALPPPWDAATLWASPLSRAVETARLVSGQAPQTHAALMEMNWGNWEGLEGIRLRADPSTGFKDIEDWGWRYRPPGGESPEELRHRLLPWVEELQGDNVAVCHIGVMRVLMAQASGWAFDGPAPFQIKRNRFYVLTIEGTAWRLDPDPVRLIQAAP